MLHRTTRSLTVAAVATVGLAVSAATASAGTVTAAPKPLGTWEAHYDQWDDPDDKGGVSISESTTKLETGEYVSASFQAYGEILKINDRHSNGRPAIARLTIGSGGPAVYYGNGDGTSRTLNLSFAEGQRVYLQVCTSDSPNAECTQNAWKPGTT
ncbi:hypothetical protein [Aeromicrobium sp. CTD01-1L150]|uniref:hypothetical protein n=1 Tax=Aeromicrobium sp. CTD01-1L150 TaxID=3341830 RepID=UPI0035C1027E